MYVLPHVFGLLFVCVLAVAQRMSLQRNDPVFFLCFFFGIRCTYVKVPFFLICAVIQLRTAPVPCASQTAFPEGKDRFCILRAYMFIYVFVWMCKITVKERSPPPWPQYLPTFRAPCNTLNLCPPTCWSISTTYFGVFFQVSSPINIITWYHICEAKQRRKYYKRLDWD